ncbi:GNAT family N-acetyltransferase [Cohnella sp.]|uniref:GNAT family N-acetyltransferase n=1 Tax=Cohnella sp. TaxID=1883426 RepID=UPI003567CA7B
MSNPKKDIKKDVEDIWQSIDGIKTDMRSAILEVKDVIVEARESFANWKEGANMDEMGELVKEGNAFVIHGKEGQIGEITYAPIDENTWVINHTYVSPPYRGRDVAQRMLRRVAEEARLENKKIVPLCSYAAAQFKRNLEYDDVWQQSEV